MLEYFTSHQISSQFKKCTRDILDVCVNVPLSQRNNAFFSRSTDDDNDDCK